MPERTDYWPEYLTIAVVEDWRDGLSAGAIARKYGMTRNQIAGKIHRMKADRHDRGPIRTERKVMGRRAGVHNDLWDAKVFEPYTVFKARRQRERMEAGR